MDNILITELSCQIWAWIYTENTKKAINTPRYDWSVHIDRGNNKLIFGNCKKQFFVFFRYMNSILQMTNMKFFALTSRLQQLNAQKPDQYTNLEFYGKR